MHRTRTMFPLSRTSPSPQVRESTAGTHQETSSRSRITFDREIQVTRQPGSNDQHRSDWSECRHSETDGATVFFTYTVAEGDEDTDGIAVVANSLDLNGGAIRADQGDADATLIHPRQPDH